MDTIRAARPTLINLDANMIVTGLSKMVALISPSRHDRQLGKIQPGAGKIQIVGTGELN